MFNSTDISCRCRPFAGHPIAMHMVRVEGADVLVYDEIAGHFTRCHSISPYYIGKILRHHAELVRDAKVVRDAKLVRDIERVHDYYFPKNKRQAAQAVGDAVRDAAELRAM